MTLSIEIRRLVNLMVDVSRAVSDSRNHIFFRSVSSVLDAVYMVLDLRYFTFFPTQLKVLQIFLGSVDIIAILGIK